MDEIKIILRSMQDEMKQQKIDIRTMKEDIKTAINENINEKFKNFEIKNQQIEEKLESQQNKIDSFERYMRRKNLLIFGVEEKERNYYQLEERVLDIINNKINIKCDRYAIESVRRLGKKSEKIRPVVLTLLTMGIKIQILKNKNNLESSPYYIKEDYPMDILNKRRALQIEVQKAREQGKNAIIKYDRLVILGNNIQHEKTQKKHNNKRNLSSSPETTQKTSKTENYNQKQPNKINKTNSMNNFLLKKPTLTPAENATPPGQSSSQITE
ncbi:hypothetical protein O0L34_g9341 [Tuta absoluta]|nr:hypothetical protein O0L34_g9341 [Tuta absoluta]